MPGKSILEDKQAFLRSSRALRSGNVPHPATYRPNAQPMKTPAGNAAKTR